MANGSAIKFAGVAQRPERGRKPSGPPVEVAGENPAPRSNVPPFPRGWFAPEPWQIAIAGLCGGIALMIIGLAGYAASIVFRGLP